jgi:hypothetical protein
LYSLSVLLAESYYNYALLQGDEIVDELGSILEELQQKLPLLEEVTNPALQQRHWVEVFEALGILESFCPVELERRQALETAAREGKAPDLNGLVWLFHVQLAPLYCVWADSTVEMQRALVKVRYECG